ncbi:MAG: hypothetical protein HYS07_07955 [Chlamydiae bacterium]|nr:hypothetical protein [Chlamydiota bacterium]MBI3278070.1 hypothetical protein [Chlamydiota bacterium]
MIFKNFQKFISIVLCVSFLIYDISMSWGQDHVIGPLAVSSLGAIPFQNLSVKASSLLENIKIPSDIGEIVDQNIIPHQPLLFILEDIHCNLGVQKNIERILKQLEVESSNQPFYVFSEAAAGFMDLSFFTSFPDQKAVATTQVKLLENQEINGLESFLIHAGPQKTIGWGVEELGTYVDNVKLMKQLMEERELQSHEWENLEETFKNLRQKIYSKELLKLVEKREKYREYKIGMGEYVKAVNSRQSTVDRSKGINIFFPWIMDRGLWSKNFPQLTLYLQLQALEEETDISKVESEYLSFLSELEKKLPKEESNEVLKNVLEHRLGRISDEEHYLFLSKYLDPEDGEGFSPLFFNPTGTIKSREGSGELEVGGVMEEEVTPSVPLKIRGREKQRISPLKVRGVGGVMEGEEVTSSVPFKIRGRKKQKELYPNLKLFIQQMSLLKQISWEKLDEEIEHFEGELIENLAIAPQAKELLELEKNYEVLKRVMTMEGKREDLKAVWSSFCPLLNTIPPLLSIPPLKVRGAWGVTSLKGPGELGVRGVMKKEQVTPSVPLKIRGRKSLKREKEYVTNFSQVLKKLCDENNLPFESPDFGDIFKIAQKFYAKVLERDQIMYKKTIKMMEERKLKYAALLIGGFHTEGFKERLKAANIGYCVIAPRMNKADDRRVYFQKMKEFGLVVSGESKSDIVDLLKKMGKDFLSQAKLSDADFESWRTHSKFYQPIIESLMTENTERGKLLGDPKLLNFVNGIDALIKRGGVFKSLTESYLKKALGKDDYQEFAQFLKSENAQSGKAQSKLENAGVATQWAYATGRTSEGPPVEVQAPAVEAGSESALREEVSQPSAEKVEFGQKRGPSKIPAGLVGLLLAVFAGRLAYGAEAGGSVLASSGISFFGLLLVSMVLLNVARYPSLERLLKKIQRMGGLSILGLAALLSSLGPVQRAKASGESTSAAEISKNKEALYASPKNPTYMTFCLLTTPNLPIRQDLSQLASLYGVEQEDMKKALQAVQRVAGDRQRLSGLTRSTFENVAKMISDALKDLKINDPEFFVRNVLYPYLTFEVTPFSLMQDQTKKAIREKTEELLGREAKSALEDLVKSHFSNSMDDSNRLNQALKKIGFQVIIGRVSLQIGSEIMDIPTPQLWRIIETLPVQEQNVGDILVLERAGTFSFTPNILGFFHKEAPDVTIISEGIEAESNISEGIEAESKKKDLSGNLLDLETLRRDNISMTVMHEGYHKWSEERMKDVTNEDREIAGYLAEAIYGPHPEWALVGLRTYVRRYAEGGVSRPVFAKIIELANSATRLSQEENRGRAREFYSGYKTKNGRSLPPLDDSGFGAIAKKINRLMQFEGHPLLLWGYKHASLLALLTSGVGLGIAGWLFRKRRLAKKREVQIKGNPPDQSSPFGLQSVKGTKAYDYLRAHKVPHVLAVILSGIFVGVWEEGRYRYSSALLGVGWFSVSNFLTAFYSSPSGHFSFSQLAALFIMQGFALLFICLPFLWVQGEKFAKDHYEVYKAKGKYNSFKVYSEGPEYKVHYIFGLLMGILMAVSSLLFFLFFESYFVEWLGTPSSLWTNIGPSSGVHWSILTTTMILHALNNIAVQFGWIDKLSKTFPSLEKLKDWIVMQSTGGGSELAPIDVEETRVDGQFEQWLRVRNVLASDETLESYVGNSGKELLDILDVLGEQLKNYRGDREISGQGMRTLIEGLEGLIRAERPQDGERLHTIVIDIKMIQSIAEAGLLPFVRTMRANAQAATLAAEKGLVWDLEHGTISQAGEEGENQVHIAQDIQEAVGPDQTGIRDFRQKGNMTASEAITRGVGYLVLERQWRELKDAIKTVVTNRITKEIKVPIRLYVNAGMLKDPEKAQEVMGQVGELRKLEEGGQSVEIIFFNAKNDPKPLNETQLAKIREDYQTGDILEVENGEDLAGKIEKANNGPVNLNEKRYIAVIGPAEHLDLYGRDLMSHHIPTAFGNIEDFGALLAIALFSTDRDRLKVFMRDDLHFTTQEVNDLLPENGRIPPFHQTTRLGHDLDAAFRAAGIAQKNM